MPAIKRKPVSELYQIAMKASSEKLERNDCAVRAVMIIADVSYDLAHATLKEEGRRELRGTPTVFTIRALRKLGFKAIQVNKDQIIQTYPAGHRHLKSITTHHPARFAKVWPKDKSYLALTNGHIAAIKNGVTHDWTSSRAIRINYLYEVTKVEE